jgi:hypothetical protein
MSQKRTIRKNKSKKKKQRNRYKKRRSYKKNTAGNVVADLNSIKRDYELNPEEVQSFKLEKWVKNVGERNPYMLSSVSATLGAVYNNRVVFNILSPDDGLTTDERTFYKYNFGLFQDIEDGIDNSFPLTLVKKLSNEASGRKKKKKSKKHKRKPRKKTRRGGKRRK